MVNEREPVKTTDEIRGGETPGVARYVLVISTILIVAFLVALLVYYR